MIFNPLFLNESGNSKLLVPSSTKLSQNKYLFSDIVKVVMKPINNSQKLPDGSENLLSFQSGSTVSESLQTIKLKLNFLKDINPEVTDKTLVELLPNEIVKLLSNKENNPQNGDAVTYISKEILGGELQTFVKDLLGNDFINNHLTSENGLLLSLEDNTSAVNFELARESSKNVSNPKIAVQTIVVPIKSRLFTKLTTENGDSTLFRFNNQETLQLNGVGTQKFKPIISVYSFKQGTDNFRSLTQTLNSDKDLGHSEIKNIKLPSLGEFKQESSSDIKYASHKLDRELLAKNLAQSKIFQFPKEKSDFAV
ncbi:MAG: hypothetical protein R3250_02685, partial [Melioribacteraceae bacterium]|nr:hypothetical protein [Melioribacteraceae bacterium]